MKRLLILISIMFLAGCVSKFSVEKANTYVLSHPDRPDHIKEAISNGQVVLGMNEEEVAICKGKPDIITTQHSYPSNMKTTIWCYFDGAPTKRLCFCYVNGSVQGINEFTQTGMPVFSVNPGPIIRPNPDGPFHSDPIISPASQNVIVQPRQIITTPLVNKNCSKK